MAGKRAGLDGERSGLFHQAIRIIKEMRDATNGKYPRYAVWENVAGAFSSSGGNDFKAVLEAFIGVKEENVQVPAPEKGKWAKADVLLGDGWSLAYRTFDSQYWSVPQRRTRIYLVADFNGESAGEVLFKSDGLSGYSAESFGAWQRIARGIETGTGTASGKFAQFCVNPQGSSSLTITEEQTGTLIAQDHGNHPAVLEIKFPVLGDQGGDVISVTDDVTCTLRAQSTHPPCVIDENNIPIDNKIANNANIALNDRGDAREDVTDALRVGVGHTLCLAAGFCSEHSAKARSIGYEEEKSPTLRAGVVPAALSIENHPTDSRIKIADDGKVQTLCGRAGTGGGNVPMVAEPTSELKEIKAFGICSNGSNGMKSDNPNVGFYEAATSKTLDSTGGRPDCNQGGIAVVEAYNLVQNQAEKADVARALDCSIGHLSSRQGGTTVVNAGELTNEAEDTAIDNATVETYDVRFTSEGTKNARGHCYKTNTSRCLDTGGESPESNHGGLAIVAFSANQRDEVRDLNDCAGAVQAQPGMKQQTFIAIQGSMIGRDDKNGPQGSGINEDVCFTLNCIDRHAVAMPNEHKESNEHNEPNELNKPNDFNEPNANENPTYATTVGSFMHAEKEKANTLMARDYKDPQIVNDKQHSNEQAYIVRRLTPTECARLQAFPDWWCQGLETHNPSNEEIAFWKNVWDEWNAMNNKKPKTENQIRKWLASPYSDASEYALWGNGITASVAWFVLAGIVWASSR